MAATPAKSGNDSVGYFWTKDEADKVKHKLNGLSTSVDMLKVSAGFAAVGFTPLKIDGAFFKVDEKGITIGGRQRYTWPYTRDAKEKLEQKLTRTGEKAEKAYGEAERAVGMAKRLQGQSGGANWAAATETKNAEKAKKELDRTFTQMKKTDQAIKEMEEESGEKKKLIEKQSEATAKTLATMDSRISSLQTKMRELAAVAAGS
ncbi:hypothetical protein AB0E08_09640 [Streptomyces sp. NPDC048281]|uniref:hypothetical protein n=1 Tax=Streptomyces sp. NPDC048281 TaxID=3154715 RepID=UPI003435D89E